MPFRIGPPRPLIIAPRFIDSIEATTILTRGATTEQVLRLFSLAQRHRLLRDGHTVQLFDAELTDLQRQILALIGVPTSAYRARA